MRRKILVVLISSIQLVGCSYNNSVRLKYNYQDKHWQFSQNYSVMKYNVYEKNWTFAPENATMKYNYNERRWEYEK